MFEKQLHQALLRAAGSFLSFDEVVEEDGNNTSNVSASVLFGGGPKITLRNVKLQHEEDIVDGYLGQFLPTHIGVDEARVGEVCVRMSATSIVGMQPTIDVSLKGVNVVLKKLSREEETRRQNERQKKSEEKRGEGGGGEQIESSKDEDDDDDFGARLDQAEMIWLCKNLENIDFTEIMESLFVKDGKKTFAKDDDTYVARFLKTLLANVSVSISNLHIRFEDSVTVINKDKMGVGIVCGIKLDALLCESVSSIGDHKRKYNRASHEICKKTTITNLSVYFDELGTSDDMNEANVLEPLSLDLIYVQKVNADALDNGGTPRVTLKVNVHDNAGIRVGLRKHQYDNFNRVLAALGREKEIRRPTERVRENPRLWWNYARLRLAQCKATKIPKTPRLMKISAKEVSEAHRKRQRYMELSSRVNGADEEDVLDELFKIEKSLSFEVALTWRCIAQVHSLQEDGNKCKNCANSVVAISRKVALNTIKWNRKEEEKEIEKEEMASNEEVSTLSSDDLCQLDDVLKVCKDITHPHPSQCWKGPEFSVFISFQSVSISLFLGAEASNPLPTKTILENSISVKVSNFEFRLVKHVDDMQSFLNVSDIECYDISERPIISRLMPKRRAACADIKFARKDSRCSLTGNVSKFIIRIDKDTITRITCFMDVPEDVREDYCSRTTSNNETKAKNFGERSANETEKSSGLEMFETISVVVDAPIIRIDARKENTLIIDLGTISVHRSKVKDLNVLHSIEIGISGLSAKILDENADKNTVFHILNEVEDLIISYTGTQSPGMKIASSPKILSVDARKDLCVSMSPCRLMTILAIADEFLPYSNSGEKDLRIEESKNVEYEYDSNTRVVQSEHHVYIQQSLGIKLLGQPMGLTKYKKERDDDGTDGIERGGVDRPTTSAAIHSEVEILEIVIDGGQIHQTNSNVDSGTEIKCERCLEIKDLLRGGSFLSFKNENLTEEKDDEEDTFVHARISEIAISLYTRSPRSPYWSDIYTEMVLSGPSMIANLSRPTLGSFWRALDEIYVLLDRNIQADEAVGRLDNWQSLDVNSSVTNFKLTICTNSLELNAVLEEEDWCKSDGKKEAFNIISGVGTQIEIMNLNTGLNVECALPDLMMEDLTIDPSHRYRHFVNSRKRDGASFARLAYKNFDYRQESVYPGYDQILILNMDNAEVTFLMRFFYYHVLGFFSGFLPDYIPIESLPSALQEAARIERDQWLRVGTFAYDVSITNSSTILPRSTSATSECILVDSKRVHVYNQFKWEHGTSHLDAEAILMDKMTIDIHDFSMAMSDVHNKGSLVFGENIVLSNQSFLRHIRPMETLTITIAGPTWDPHDSKCGSEIEISTEGVFALELDNYEFSVLCNVIGTNFGEESWEIQTLFSYREDLEWKNPKTSPLTKSLGQRIIVTLPYTVLRLWNAPRSNRSKPLSEIHMGNLYVNYYSHRNYIDYGLNISLCDLKIRDKRIGTGKGHFEMIQKGFNLDESNVNQDERNLTFLHLDVESVRNETNIEMNLHSRCCVKVDPLFFSELALFFSFSESEIVDELTKEIIRMSPLEKRLNADVQFDKNRSDNGLIKLREDLNLNSGRRILADGPLCFSNQCILDGDGYTIRLPNRQSTRGDQIPLIILGRNKILTFKNCTIEIPLPDMTVNERLEQINIGDYVSFGSNSKIVLDESARIVKTNMKNLIQGTSIRTTSNATPADQSSLRARVRISSLELLIFDVGQHAADGKIAASEYISLKTGVDLSYASLPLLKVLDQKGRTEVALYITNLEAFFCDANNRACFDRLLHKTNIDFTYKEASNGSIQLDGNVSEVDIHLNTVTLQNVLENATKISNSIQAVSASFGASVAPCGAFEYICASRAAGLKFFRVIPPRGYASLGDVLIFAHQHSPSTSVIAINAASNVCTAPTGFIKVWESKSNDCVAWWPVPKEGFIAMGCVVTASKDKMPNTENYRCVRQEILTESTFRDCVYSGGTDAEQLWTVDNSSQTFFAGQWQNVGNTGKSLRPAALRDPLLPIHVETSLIDKHQHESPQTSWDISPKRVGRSHVNDDSLLLNSPQSTYGNIYDGSDDGVEKNEDMNTSISVLIPNVHLELFVREAKRPFASVAIDSIRLGITGDEDGEEVSEHGEENLLHGALSSNLSVYFYNPIVSSWEPILQRFKIEGEYSNNKRKMIEEHNLTIPLPICCDVHSSFGENLSSFLQYDVNMVDPSLSSKYFNKDVNSLISNNLVFPVFVRTEYPSRLVHKVDPGESFKIADASEKLEYPNPPHKGIENNNERAWRHYPERSKCHLTLHLDSCKFASEVVELSSSVPELQCSVRIYSHNDKVDQDRSLLQSSRCRTRPLTSTISISKGNGEIERWYKWDECFSLSIPLDADPNSCLLGVTVIDLRGSGGAGSPLSESVISTAALLNSSSSGDLFPLLCEGLEPCIVKCSARLVFAKVRGQVGNLLKTKSSLSRKGKNMPSISMFESGPWHKLRPRKDVLMKSDSARTDSSSVEVLFFENRSFTMTTSADISGSLEYSLSPRVQLRNTTELPIEVLIAPKEMDPHDASEHILAFDNQPTSDLFIMKRLIKPGELLPLPYSTIGPDARSSIHMRVHSLSSPSSWGSLVKDTNKFVPKILSYEEILGCRALSSGMEGHEILLCDGSGQTSWFLCVETIRLSVQGNYSEDRSSFDWTLIIKAPLKIRNTLGGSCKISLYSSEFDLPNMKMDKAAFVKALESNESISIYNIHPGFHTVIAIHSLRGGWKISDNGRFAPVSPSAFASKVARNGGMNSVNETFELERRDGSKSYLNAVATIVGRYIGDSSEKDSSANRLVTICASVMIVNRTGTLLAYRATYKDRDGTRTSTQKGDDRSDADLNSRLSDPASSTNTSRKRTFDSRKKSIDGRSDRDGNVTSMRRMPVATMHSLKTTPVTSLEHIHWTPGDRDYSTSEMRISYASPTEIDEGSTLMLEFGISNSDDANFFTKNLEMSPPVLVSEFDLSRPVIIEANGLEISGQNVTSVCLPVSVRFERQSLLSKVSKEEGFFDTEIFGQAVTVIVEPAITLMNRTGEILDITDSPDASAWKSIPADHSKWGVPWSWRLSDPEQNLFAKLHRKNGAWSSKFNIDRDDKNTLSVRLLDTTSSEEGQNMRVKSLNIDIERDSLLTCTSTINFTVRRNPIIIENTNNEYVLAFREILSDGLARVENDTDFNRASFHENLRAGSDWTEVQPNASIAFAWLNDSEPDRAIEAKFIRVGNVQSSTKRERLFEKLPSRIYRAFDSKGLTELPGLAVPIFDSGGEGYWAFEALKDGLSNTNQDDFKSTLLTFATVSFTHADDVNRKPSKLRFGSALSKDDLQNFAQTREEALQNETERMFCPITAKRSRYSFSLKNITLSLLDKRINEILVAHVDGFSISHDQKETFTEAVITTTSVRLKSLQIDDMTHKTIYPVLLRRIDNDVAQDNLFSARIRVREDLRDKIIHYDRVELNFTRTPIHVNINEPSLWSVLLFCDYFVPRSSSGTKSAKSKSGEGVGIDDVSVVVGNIDRTIYVQHFSIDPITVAFSFRAAGLDRIRPRRAQELIPGIVGFINLSESTVKLKGFALHHQLTKLSTFKLDVGKAYGKQLLGQIFRVLSGISGLASVGLGLGKISNILGGHTAIGVGMNLRKSISKASHSKIYMQDDRPEVDYITFTTGAIDGLTYFTLNVVKGATGILYKPVLYGYRDGASGFFKGVKKATLGTVSKPIAGAVGFLGHITLGVEGSITNALAALGVKTKKKHVKRIRPARLPSMDGVLRAYDEQDGTASMLWRKIKQRRFVRHISDDEDFAWVINIDHDNIIIATSRRLFKIAVKKHLSKRALSIEWDLFWKSVKCVERSREGDYVDLIYSNSSYLDQCQRISVPVILQDTLSDKILLSSRLFSSKNEKSSSEPRRSTKSSIRKSLERKRGNFAGEEEDDNQSFSYSSTSSSSGLSDYSEHLNLSTSFDDRINTTDNRKLGKAFKFSDGYKCVYSSSKRRSAGFSANAPEEENAPKIFGIFNPVSGGKKITFGSILQIGTNAAPSSSIPMPVVNKTTVTGEDSIFAYPVKFELAGKIKGSNVRFFWPVPPEGYVALGVYSVRGKKAPSKRKSVVCIRQDLAKPFKITKKGSSAFPEYVFVEKADFTLWRILNTVNTFTIVDGHAPLPPEDETFADFKRYDL